MLRTAAEVTGHTNANEKVLWQAYASWSQFAWLYLIGTVAAFRGLLLWRFDIPGWEFWLLGTGALLLCAALLRYWVQYAVTSHRVLVRNVFTGAMIETIELEQVQAVVVQQGLVAWWLGIGTLRIVSRDGDRVIRFRGIRDPESARNHIETVRLNLLFGRV